MLRALANALCWRQFVGIIVASSALIACDAQRDSSVWTDQVRLQTGQTIAVKRTVWFDPPHAKPERRSPYLYGLSFPHPNTGELIAWKGDVGESPIALSFTPDDAYLIVLVSGLSLARWGCPDLPYLAYSRKRNGANWLQVSIAGWPGPGPIANLSYRYDGYWMTQQPVQSSGAIASRNALGENYANGYFQPKIPASMDEWRYQFKNEKQRCVPENPFSWTAQAPYILLFFFPVFVWPFRMALLVSKNIRSSTSQRTILLYSAAFAIEGGALVASWFYGWGVATAYYLMPFVAVGYLVFALGLASDGLLRKRNHIDG